MKVIFLDCDGVINSLASFMLHETLYKKKHGAVDRVDPIAIGLIDRLCEETKASIVLSSAWRTTHGTPRTCLLRTRRTLRNAGAGCLARRLIGTTPSIDIEAAKAFRRGREINLWLNIWHKENRGKQIERYVIIDDDSDFLPEQRPWFVKTHFANGFRVREYVHAMMLLDPKHRDCQLWKSLCA